MKLPFDVILWWEVRRPLFNAAILGAGLLSLFVIMTIGSTLAWPGEDVEEPLGIIFGGLAYALAANAAYTLGWITEIAWGWGDAAKTASVRPRIFMLGLAFSVAVTLAPAVLVPACWAVFGFQHGPPDH